MTLHDERGASSRTGIGFRVLGAPAEPAQRQIRWAIGELEARLAERAIPLREAEAADAGPGPDLVLALGTGPEIAQACRSAGVALAEAPESFAIFRSAGSGPARLWVCGADPRGLVYAITELADRVRLAPDAAGALAFAAPLVGTPAARVRSISRCFQSEIEDLPWFHDRAGWAEYLTHLATHRFNRIALTLGMQYNYPYGNEFVSDVYFHLAYPFLVAPPGHDVAISNLDAGERRRNLETLKFIAREADRRGLDFQLALWTQSYDFDDCPNARHQITGLGPDNIAAYCRDSLALILAEVPEISGLTLRVHVESGIPEGDHGFWRTCLDAVRGAGRSLRLDLHAKGIDETLIGIALETGMPVTVSPKYTSEHLGLPYHQASIRALELPSPGEAPLYSGRDAEKHAGKWRFSEGSRRFMRYSYGDLMREDRPYGIVFRIWPGTTRVLLWGDPELAGGYGRNAGFAGAQGVELCEPLSFKGRMGTGSPGSRTGLQAPWLVHDRDWRKFDYTYRVWGRSLYDPEAEPEAFDRWLAARFGAAGAPCGSALASASRILPLITLAHAPTASNNSYWPEMYENMSILHEAPPLPYGYELARPARFGTVGSCDPQLFLSPAEFAACLHAGAPVRRIAPLTWANWLASHAAAAAVAMARALAAAGEAGAGAELRLVAADVAILGAIGRFFADKVRAAAFWEYHLLSGEPRAAQEALAHYRRARDAWAEAAAVSREVYLPDIAYGPHSWLRGRWDDRLPAIEQDLADMAALVARLPAGAAAAPEPGRVAQMLAWTTPQLQLGWHAPPERFRPGEPLALAIAPAGAGRRDLRLHYRHVDQSKPWQSAPMRLRDGAYRATIPGDYTGSPYPIIYYFEFLAPDHSCFFPGVAEDISQTPYFCIGGRRSPDDRHEPGNQATQETGR